MAHADHPVCGKTTDNINQCPVCNNRLKFVEYRVNTGLHQYDFGGNTCRAHTIATKLAQTQVAAQSAELPSSVQNSEKEHPENTFKTLPPTSMPQTIESPGLQSLSFIDKEHIRHILFESSSDPQFGHLSNFAYTPNVSIKGVIFPTSEHHYQ